MNLHKRTYKEPSGKTRTVWRARYPDPTKGGKAQIERQFATKREAERWLTAQRSALQRGEHIDPRESARTVGSVAEEWRGTWLDLKPKTRVGYESILNRHVLLRWEGVRVGAVTPEAIQDWVNELAEEREPATVKRVYGVLRSVLKVAVERRYITANPCDPVRLPRQEAAAVRDRVILTAGEVTALAEAITPHYRVLVYAAAYTGLRSGELLALRRKDVDLLHGKLNVDRNLSDVSGHLVFVSPKSSEARSVGLQKFLTDLISEQLSSCESGPEALVFPAPGGGPLRHHNMYLRHFKPAVKEALPPEKHALRFHDLRHTCASLLIAAGAHPKAIQEHLGHKDIQTTFNVYGHLLPSAQEALAAALDETFNGASELPANVAELLPASST